MAAFNPTDRSAGATGMPGMNTTINLGNWTQDHRDPTQEDLIFMGSMIAAWLLSLIRTGLYLVGQYTLQYTFTTLGPVLLSAQTKQQNLPPYATSDGIETEAAKERKDNEPESQAVEAEDQLAPDFHKDSSNTNREETNDTKLSSSEPTCSVVSLEPISPSISGLLSRLRSTHGLLRGFLRGFWCHLLYRTVHSIAIAVFVVLYPFAEPAHFVNYELAGMFAACASCHLLGAWVHYCISTKHRHRVRPWILPFWRTLRVTWRTHLLCSAQAATSRYFIRVVTKMYTLDVPVDRKLETKTHAFDDAFWQGLGQNCALMAFAIVLSGIPRTFTNVFLYRVYASILPQDGITMVPLDRAFGSEKARKRGFVTVREVWTSMGRKEWEMFFRYYGQLLVIYMGVAVVYVVVPPLDHLVRKWQIHFLEKVDKEGTTPLFD